MSKLHAVLGAAALAFSVQSQATVITFDKLAGTKAADTFASTGKGVFSGFNFNSIFATSLQQTATGLFADAGLAAYNGTDYLTALQTLTISSATTGLFSISSIDLVGWMGLLDGATLVGTRKDNSTITYNANFNGTPNALKWGGNDFNKVTLTNFTDLKSLTISARGVGVLALDNVNVTSIAAVPEPGSLAIVGLGLGALAFARRRKA